MASLPYSVSQSLNFGFGPVAVRIGLRPNHLFLKRSGVPIVPPFDGSRIRDARTSASRWNRARSSVIGPSALSVAKKEP
jgi:hypothetical protein